MRDNRPRQRSTYHNRNACSCYSFPLYTITSSISLVQTVPVPVINYIAVPIQGDTTRTYLQKNGRCERLQGIGEGNRNVITRYPMRSLMKPTEKREPTITYSGMIPGEGPPYRPLLSEQIDIEQSLQELGQVSAGLVDVEDALEAVSYTHLTLPTIYSV